MSEPWISPARAPRSRGLPLCVICTLCAAAIMASIVVVETTVLFATGKVAGPVWFDVAAAASLLVAIMVGAEVTVRWLGTAGRKTAAA